LALRDYALGEAKAIGGLRQRDALIISAYREEAIERFGNDATMFPLRCMACLKASSGDRRSERLILGYFEDGI